MKRSLTTIQNYSFFGIEVEEILLDSGYYETGLFLKVSLLCDILI